MGWGGSHLWEPLLVHVVHHHDFVVVGGGGAAGTAGKEAPCLCADSPNPERCFPRAEGSWSCTKTPSLSGASAPETPRAGPHGGGAAATILVRDALGAAEVFGQKVQLVHRGLVGELMKALLGGAGGLGESGESEPELEQPSTRPWPGAPFCDPSASEFEASLGYTE